MAEPILDLFALFGPIPPRGAEPGTDALRAAMAKSGVAGAVTLSTRAIFHTAAAGNRETQVLCGQSNGVLLPAGLLDPRTPRAETLLTGAHLVMLFPATQGWPVDYAPLEYAIASMASNGIKTPLFFEATRCGDATALHNLLQRTHFTGRVVLASATGASLSEAFALAKSDPRYLLSTDSLRGIGELALAIDQMGTGRVVFGSGSIARGSLAAMLATIRAAGLPETEAAQVLGGTTRQLLAAGGAVA